MTPKTYGVFFPGPSGPGLIEANYCGRILRREAQAFRGLPAPASLKRDVGSHSGRIRSGFPGPSGPGLIEASPLADGVLHHFSFPGPSGPGLIEAVQHPGHMLCPLPLSGAFRPRPH